MIDTTLPGEARSTVINRHSCRFGERCRFSHHVTQSQSKPNPFGFGTKQQQPPNPFGFGTGIINQQQQQQQQLNPFGFGTGSIKQQQTQHQQSNPFEFGAGSMKQQQTQQQQSNPFGSTEHSGQQTFRNKWIRSVNAPPSTQTDSKPQTTSHTCKDPGVCKQLIVEDLTNERPLWKLTCYAHFRGLPCDIHGDISYEELRSAAYDDARQGLSLKSIVERESNLLNSKLLEFDRLFHSPYVLSHTSTIPTSFSSVNVSPISVPGGTFFQAFSNGHYRPSTMSGPKSSFPDHSLTAKGSEVTFATPGFLTEHLQKLPGGMFSQNVTAAQSITTFQHPNIFEDSRTNLLTSADVLENKGEIGSTDAGIWLKEKWKPKEIPEEEPPSKYCFD